MSPAAYWELEGDDVGWGWVKTDSTAYIQTSY